MEKRIIGKLEVNGLENNTDLCTPVACTPISESSHAQGRVSVLFNTVRTHNVNCLTGGSRGADCYSVGEFLRGRKFVPEVSCRENYGL